MDAAAPFGPLLAHDHDLAVQSGEFAAPPYSKAAGRLGSALVVLAGLVVFGWQVGRPGVWRDEGATLDVCQRSLAQTFDLTRNLDLVHLAYYLLARAVWQVDDSVTAVRLISGVAMSLAAGMLVPIGRRLGSLWVGVLAGSVLVVNPLASRYAQEARPYAIVTLLATVSTYLLLRLCEPQSGRGRQVAYAVSLALLGLFNILALMLVVVHAAYVLVVEPRRGTRWLVPAVTGLAVITPFVLLTFTQRGQVSWITAPHIYDLRAIVTDEFGSRSASVVVVALVVLVLATRFVLGSPLPGPNLAALVLGGAWALLPPLMLFVESQALPMWDEHYLVFSLPGLTLLLASVVPEVDRTYFDLRIAAAIAVPVLLLAGLGLNAQKAYRDPVFGHTENLQDVADYLYANAEAGDAVLFVPSELRVIENVYPAAFNGVNDVAVAQTPLQAANLDGTPVTPAELAGRLAPYKRVWLITGVYKLPVSPGGLDPVSLHLLATGYQAGDTRAVADITITRYTAK